MKIAIIGAMEEEVTLLRDKIENKTVEVIAGCEFTTGYMDGVEVVLLAIRNWKSKCSYVDNNFT